MAGHSGGGVILAGINRIGWRLNTQFIHNTAKANREMTVNDGTTAIRRKGSVNVGVLLLNTKATGYLDKGKKKRRDKKEGKEKIGKGCTEVLDCTLRRGHWPLCHVLILPWYIYFPEGALGGGMSDV